LFLLLIKKFPHKSELEEARGGEKAPLQLLLITEMETGMNK
jgi:hypothetical protein